MKFAIPTNFCASGNRDVHFRKIFYNLIINGCPIPAKIINIGKKPTRSKT